MSGGCRCRCVVGERWKMQTVCCELEKKPGGCEAYWRAVLMERWGMRRSRWMCWLLEEGVDAEYRAVPVCPCPAGDDGRSSDISELVCTVCPASPFSRAYELPSPSTLAIDFTSASAANCFDLCRAFLHCIYLAVISRSNRDLRAPLFCHTARESCYKPHQLPYQVKRSHHGCQRRSWFCAP